PARRVLPVPAEPEGERRRHDGLRVLRWAGARATRWTWCLRRHEPQSLPRSERNVDGGVASTRPDRAEGIIHDREVLGMCLISGRQASGTAAAVRANGASVPDGSRKEVSGAGVIVLILAFVLAALGEVVAGQLGSRPADDWIARLERPER